jgi:CHASE2 domain-containing sensor protein
MKLASYINPEAVELAKKRDNDIEIINWRGNYEKFYHLDAEDVLNGETDLSFIENKIVILGFMGLRYLGEESLEDTFFTPMNKNTGSKSVPDMYGVVVHANIISMILNNDFINDIPHWVDYILAVLFVFLNVSLFMWVGTYYKLYYDLISKTIQLVEVIILFGINLMSMLHFQLKVDLTLAIIAIVFCGDLTELYAGSLRGIFENAYAKFTGRKSTYNED